MVKRTLNRSITAALLLLGGICPFSAFGAGEPVTGVIGLTPVLEHTCLAAYVPVPEGKALAGVVWYNNDGTATFPRVLVASGSDAGPGQLTTASVEATSVVGASSGLSELTFAEPIASGTGGVYVIFEFPVNQEQVGLGEGGGPGVGYRSGTVGTPGWVSADGMAWHRLHPSFRLAVVPTLVDAEAGMKALRTVKEPVVAAATVLQTMLRPASPNPFNPKTKLEFTLGKAGSVSLAVYNLRGELVARLVDEAYAAGAHTVEWAGLDTRGRACPSGIYFAQMKADGVVMTQRLALLR
jgi:hypothetical protein